MQTTILGCRHWSAVVVVTTLMAAPSLAGSTPAAPDRRTVTWAMLRDSLERSCCLRGTPERYSPTWLDRENCESVYGEGGDSELNDVVDQVNAHVIEERLQLGVRPAPRTPEDSSRAPEWPVEASRGFARRFLESQSFQRIVTRRVYEQLDEKGIRCPDCPPLPPVPFRRVNEDELMRYVSLYAWPDRVRPATDEEGKPTGEGKYRFHICGGLNGLHTLDDADDQLSSAAGIIAFRVIEDLADSARRHLMQVRESGGFKEIAESTESLDDRFRLETTYLRETLPPLLSQDPELRRAVRSEVGELRDDTGLDLE